MEQASAVEIALVAAIYSDGGLVFDVVDRVLTSSFSDPMCGLVFEALRDRTIADLPTDLVSVIADLKTRERFEALGGESAARAILESGEFDPASVEHYAELIVKASKRRTISNLAEKVGAQAKKGGDLTALSTALSGAITDLSWGHERYTSDIGRSADEAHRRLVALSKGELTIDLVKTGFRDLDGLIKGLRAGQLVVVGARPGMGKTAFALEIARWSASNGRRVLFFSLEMSIEEMTERVMASVAEIDLSRVQTGNLSAEELERAGEAAREMAGVDIAWNSDPMMRVPEIRSLALKARASGPLGMIVIDYLQLMSSGSARSIENRQAEVAEISRSLKILARELEIPVVALSQLSRNLESRHDKRPQLSDLRDSGQIEQDADLVLFLHREEMYDENTPDKGLTEVIVAKHRNGPIGRIQLWFEPALMRFGDLVDPKELIPVVFGSDNRFDASKGRAEAGGDIWDT